MSLLDNQTYKKRLSFGRIDDDEKTVSFTISVSCNHDIDKQVLNDIELVINDLFLKDYESQETIDERKRDEKLAEKLRKMEEKQMLLEQKKAKKAEEENSKLVQEYQKKYTTKTAPISTKKTKKI
ncbi:MAG: hypothetical protein EOO43_19340 [Flavobacterium sp.]|nr:MAG: hypothetical protein EOO43_19340 [Flavobacterium sp.]